MDALAFDIHSESLLNLALAICDKMVYANF